MKYDAIESFLDHNVKLCNDFNASELLKYNTDIKRSEIDLGNVKSLDATKPVVQDINSQVMGELNNEYHIYDQIIEKS